MLLKHNKYGGILDIIYAAVVIDGISAIFRGGAGVAGVAGDVVAN